MARAERSHTPPPQRFLRKRRGGGGRRWPCAHHKIKDSEQRPRRRERRRSRGCLARTPPLQPLQSEDATQTTQGPGGRAGRGCQPFRLPSQDRRGNESFQMSPYRTPQICWCLLAAHGTSPTPRTPSNSCRGKKSDLAPSLGASALLTGLGGGPPFKNWGHSLC